MCVWQCRLWLSAVLIGMLLTPVAVGQSTTADDDDNQQVASHFFNRFADVDLPDGMVFQAYLRREPRPMRIYRVDVDLTVPNLQPVLAIADDPDNDGPAETVLTPPIQLARQSRMSVAINANAWSMVPDSRTGKFPGYVVGGYANVHGWVALPPRTASPIESGYWSFWIDAQRQPHIANLVPRGASDRADPVLAFAGFRGILAQGTVLVEPSEVLHPRTSIGFDAGGNTLTLVVVDGRQPGISEGASEEELARLMREFGCSDAINLDGGGSSVMLARRTDGKLQLVNRPSGITGARPVPVVFGFRANNP